MHLVEKFQRDLYTSSYPAFGSSTEGDQETNGKILKLSYSGASYMTIALQIDQTGLPGLTVSDEYLISTILMSLAFAAI